MKNTMNESNAAVDNPDPISDDDEESQRLSDDDVDSQCLSFSDNTTGQRTLNLDRVDQPHDDAPTVPSMSRDAVIDQAPTNQGPVWYSPAEMDRGDTDSHKYNHFTSREESLTYTSIDGRFHLSLTKPEAQKYLPAEKENQKKPPYHLDLWCKRMLMRWMVKNNIFCPRLTVDDKTCTDGFKDFANYFGLERENGRTHAGLRTLFISAIRQSAAYFTTQVKSQGGYIDSQGREAHPNTLAPTSMFSRGYEHTFEKNWDLNMDKKFVEVSDMKARANFAVERGLYTTAEIQEIHQFWSAIVKRSIPDLPEHRTQEDLTASQYPSAGHSGRNNSEQGMRYAPRSTSAIGSDDTTTMSAQVLPPQDGLEDISDGHMDYLSNPDTQSLYASEQESDVKGKRKTDEMDDVTNSQTSRSSYPNASLDGHKDKKSRTR